MTTTKKVIREKRTIRFRAVQAGQEIYHDRKWWVVKQAGIEPGAKFNGLDAKTKEPREETVPQFNPDNSCAVWVTRGSHSTVIVGPRNAMVKIIRTR